MARKADKGSNRQLSFKYLDENSSKSRAELLADLLSEFDMKIGYAKTLYQDWRRLGKASGDLVEAFEVRDHKDGVTVDPYMFSKHVASPPAGTVTTQAKAIKRYVSDLQERGKKAKKL